MNVLEIVGAVTVAALVFAAVARATGFITIEWYGKDDDE